MKFLTAIISLASLAAATTEMTPGTIQTQQGDTKITIDTLSALQILQPPSSLRHILLHLTVIAVPTATSVMTESST
ncbi:hypothetical protein N7520_010191 [Penicillium odoratum]|uniref:uncharacterized protein n=1 Tax=Penicillium odoratum TaxID=1167516 RepID=UPI0025496B29|nr:uncharacterized protein N7520_010191 [Penicillium odoratum]KAJ5753274.1 hypothetical protein N7520_010191 [Penicillium odoratum]